ncbi:hypothetical protein SJ05684_c31700 [Sinorhizobium sojae CCBAU 05684]|uniref:Uncharacterized protein n=1 Tax=Sinorhizobium sojae CCBAU 05684 TaxID=716928 RepID=A0A249PFZ0_9HYPH|nr:hypothetical protein SJ05684_c31700 [Sinorhizobium sojae CCBAU 05684]
MCPERTDSAPMSAGGRHVPESISTGTFVPDVVRQIETGSRQHEQKQYRNA